MTDVTWESMNLASRVAKQIENADSLVPRHQANAVHPSQDLQELVGTINYVRQTLVPFVSHPRSEKNPRPTVDFYDVCIRGLKDTLSDIHLFLKELESTFSAPTWEPTKIKLYQQDFLVKQKLDQFISLFPLPEDPSVSSPVQNNETAPRHPPLTGPQLIELVLDPEGQSVWAHFFGEYTWFVPWPEFFAQMESVTGLSMREEEQELKNTINFTRTDFVSAYEFGVFLKWFGPFTGSFGRVLEAIKQGLLCGFTPAVEANFLLKGKKEGTFLIRCSKTCPGSFAVTFIDSSSKIKHCLLHSVAPFGLTLKNPPTVYQSLKHFLDLHLNKLKHPLGNKYTLKMKIPGFQYPGGQAAPVHSHGVGDAFAPGSPSGNHNNANPLSDSNQCTICMDAPLETVFLECGHLACCSGCSTKVKLCPICRSTITRVIPIFRAN